MTPMQTAWAVSLIVAVMALPVGALRMVIYRSGDIDHTPTHRLVAWIALVLGTVGFVVFASLTVWFLATGQRPW